MASADKAGYGFWGLGDIDPCTYGAGYLDIPAALKSTLVATSPALSPALRLNRWGMAVLNTRALFAGGSGLWGTGLARLDGRLGSGGVAASGRAAVP